MSDKDIDKQYKQAEDFNAKDFLNLIETLSKKLEVHPNELLQALAYREMRKDKKPPTTVDSIEWKETVSNILVTMHAMGDIPKVDIQELLNTSLDGGEILKDISSQGEKGRDRI